MIDKNVLLKLGNYKFVIGETAYTKLSQSNSYRWTEQKRLGGRSSMFFSGVDNESLSLSGTIYSILSGRKALDEFNNLRLEAEKGAPMILVDAKGVNHGRWVITGIEGEESNAIKDSTPLKIGFTINLKAYS